GSSNSSSPRTPATGRPWNNPMHLLRKAAKAIEERRQLVALRQTRATAQAADRYAAYADQPAEFARDVLGFTFTPLQKQMAEGLLTPQSRVLTPRANGQGKRAGAAAVLLWCSAPRRPALIITTAPKFDQVKALLWKEIRRLARTAGLALPFQPKACR